ncbi:MAG TPA: HAD family phosphatase, partial [Acidobacteriaceae bacterium]|nr:HAD family phosphatase [Acidobacteriaceae bacterium]
MTTSASPTATVPRAVIFDFGRVLSMPPDADAHTALVSTAGVPDEVFEEQYWTHRHAYDAGA